MTDSQLRDLLELGAQTEAPPAPPDGFFDRAAGRRRRRNLGRLGASLGVAGAVALGATTATQGGLPFGDVRPAGPVTVAWADAPQCVRDVLARAHHRVVTDSMSAVVLDIPARKTSLTQGISAGTGWSGIDVVEVLSGHHPLTPADGFTMWDGVSPDFDLRTGRTVALVTLDRSPKPPAQDVGTPIWTFDAEARFPVQGDRMTVTCPDGTSAALPWRDSAQTWLAPDAPMQSQGSASTPR
jgi:hypothetical protein